MIFPLLDTSTKNENDGIIKNFIDNIIDEISVKYRILERDKLVRLIDFNTALSQKFTDKKLVEQITASNKSVLSQINKLEYYHEFDYNYYISKQCDLKIMIIQKLKEERTILGN